MFGAVSNASEDPSILAWCAAAGGPYLCDSNVVIQAACVVRYSAPAQIYEHMEVSENGGTPQVADHFSIETHGFLGIPIFRNLQMMLAMAPRVWRSLPVVGKGGMGSEDRINMNQCH